MKVLREMVMRGSDDARAQGSGPRAQGARTQGSGIRARRRACRSFWALGPVPWALWLLVASLFPIAAHAQDDVDYVELASLLVRDGEYERAAAALAEVDPALEGVDLVKYHTLRGLIALSGTPSDPAAAIEAFQASIEAGQSEPSIYLFLAQAQFGLERHEDVLATLALPAVAESFSQLASVELMRAQANWLLGRHQAAFAALAAGQRKFPANTQFLRRQVFFLMDLGLYQEAAANGRAYLARSEGKVEDYVAIGAALRRSKQLDEAVGFLETARLKFPGDENVVKVLAASYLDLGQPLAAAEITYVAALANPALLVEAAELFRRARQPARALMLNAQITDQGSKFKQRLGILVELERYAEVAAMERDLIRAGLGPDQELRYALAYAHFKQGDFEAVERNLQVITRPELFRKATELRRIMVDCEAERWRCS
jgi:tetratricopeptide (TPR) repeat protein